MLSILAIPTPMQNARIFGGVQLSFVKFVNSFGVAGTDRIAFVLGESRMDLLGNLQPARQPVHQIVNRPIASPYDAVAAELVEHMPDVRFDRLQRSVPRSAVG